MVVGPWGHGPSRKYGDLDFGPDADRTLFQYEQRWHEFHLEGVDNGLGGEAPVQIFYMGIDKWRGEADWPIADTRYTPWFLQAGGKLAATAPSGEGSTSYRYDPNDPVPTTGGNNCCGTPTIAGPVDQAPLDARADIVRFASDPLTAPLTVAGPVKMDLYATTDGRDTDWMIKLIDVHPDGKAYPMAEGILRARFRDGLDKPAPLHAGTGLPLQRRHGRHRPRLPARPPDSRRRHLEQLPAVRPQPEHRGPARKGHAAAGRAADDSPCGEQAERDHPAGGEGVLRAQCAISASSSAAVDRPAFPDAFTAARCGYASAGRPRRSSARPDR
jgi:hypothetical protein